jgi:hypothetical protein
VIVSPSAETVARVMPLPSGVRNLAHQPTEPVRPQPDLHVVHPHVDPLDQRLIDPRLLAGNPSSHSRSTCSNGAAPPPSQPVAVVGADQLCNARNAR